MPARKCWRDFWTPRPRRRPNSPRARPCSTPTRTMTSSRTRRRCGLTVVRHPAVSEVLEVVVGVGVVAVVAVVVAVVAVVVGMAARTRWA